MKRLIKILLLICLFTLFIGCSKNDDIKNGEYIDYYEDGQIERINNYKNGEYDGKIIGYYESGQVKFEKNYRDGQFEGRMISYYENGKTKYEAYYKGNRASGKVTEYYESGLIECEYYCDETGIVEGSIVEYLENGERGTAVSDAMNKESTDLISLESYKNRFSSKFVSPGNYYIMAYDYDELLWGDGSFFENEFYSDLVSIEWVVGDYMKHLWGHEIYDSKEWYSYNDNSRIYDSEAFIQDMIKEVATFSEILKVTFNNTYIVGNMYCTIVEVETKESASIKGIDNNLVFAVFSQLGAMEVRIDSIDILEFKNQSDRLDFMEVSKKTNEVKIIYPEVIAKHKGLDIDLYDPNSLNLAGLDFYNERNYDYAISLFLRGASLSNMSIDFDSIAMCAYNLACTMTLKNEIEYTYPLSNILEFLELSFNFRSDRIERSMVDSDFDSIRDQRDFIDLLDQYK